MEVLVIGGHGKDGLRPHVGAAGQTARPGNRKGQDLDEASVSFAGNLTDQPEVHYTEVGHHPGHVPGGRVGLAGAGGVVLHRDRGVVAVRVRASVGRPGGSARAQWRRMRAAEWTAWTRTLPWRIAVIVGVGAVGGLLGGLLTPRLRLVVVGLAALAAGWGLRFRPSPDARAWRRGAAGERRTARLLSHLERYGWAVLHDLAVPGCQANLDHLIIGPGGVFVIDSKQYRGRLQLDPCGRLWHGRYPLAPTLRAVSFEADRAAQVLPDPGMAVVPIVAVHGAKVPWGKVVTQGVPVVSARRLLSIVGARKSVVGAELGVRQGSHLVAMIGR